MTSTHTSPRNGCHDRKPYATVHLVQDGWYDDGRRRMVAVGNVMAMDCQYQHTVLGKADARCEGCKWRQS